jgi:proteasome lid subunit RPN8/RPN11
MLQLTPEQREQMTAHGEATYPHECCGFLIGRLWEGRKWVEEVRPAGNAREDSPQNRYEISRQDWEQAEQDARQVGRQILGYYHSHPDLPAWPSPTDLEYAWPEVYSFLIMSVRDGRATELRSWIKYDNPARFEEETVLVTVEEPQ